MAPQRKAEQHSLDVVMMSSQKTQTVTVSNSLNPDQALFLSGLIRVQTACKGYQQMTLVGNELMGTDLIWLILFFIVLHVSKAIHVLTNVRVKRATCIKRLFWPPYEAKK